MSVPNPIRARLRRQTILEALKMAQGYATPEVTLRPHVDALVRPPLSDEEWRSDIDLLSSPAVGAIVQVPNKMAPELVQWAITERGETLLATLS